MRYLKMFSRRVRLIALWVLAVVGLSIVVFMSNTVAKDLRLLNSASSDNVQWTLSQVEVEFLEYELHLVRSLQEKAPDLNTLRREFDIFYSRINILRSSSLYAFLRDEPEFSSRLDKVQAFLDAAVDTIDASDAKLATAIPGLLDQAIGIRADVRMMSNSGLNFFAKDSDYRRTNVAVTLIQMAAGVAFLLIALLFLSLYLSHLNGQNIRRRAEAVQASARMKTVTATSLDAVIVSNADGLILDFNAAAEQIFGHSAQDAIGQSLGTLIVPEHHRAAHEAGMLRMRQSGERRVVGKGRVKLEAKRSNGEIFPVELAIQSADTDDGEVFVAFLRDISHRVKAEQDLVKARDQALAGEKSKTDFLATMSHEIRTPLNGLLGNLTLLRDTRLNAKQARYVKNMDTSGKLLMSHISDVLDITKYDAGKLLLRPVSMNISLLFQDIIDNQSGAASAKDTTLTWGWKGTPTNWILSDRDRIQHILMNVIGNAVKFTQNGSIAVEAEVINNADGTQDIQIAVKDTGIGMDPALQAQIFDDFVTGDSSYDRDVGGTGLGLGIAQRFVKALGGTIAVDSKSGVGSTFRIQFPIQPIAAPSLAFRAPASKDTVKSMTILLVEDNEISRVVAREMLMAAGHKVIVATNGQIAVDLAQKQKFDLILMDISMPVMDGRTATRLIRSGQGASAMTPIVALTANAMAAEQQAFLSDGMNDVLTKPLSRESLMGVIANHIWTDAQTDTHGDKGSAPVARNYIDDLRDGLGVAALQSLLDRFSAEVDQTLEHFNTDQPFDLDEVAQIAHRIAGSAATMGAIDLRVALIELEDAAKTHDQERTKTAIAALPAIWGLTRPHLGAERRDIAPQGPED